jgi:hypothetical protein
MKVKYLQEGGAVAPEAAPAPEGGQDQAMEQLA